jgi:hypothetical protein
MHKHAHKKHAGAGKCGRPNAASANGPDEFRDMLREGLKERARRAALISEKVTLVSFARVFTGCKLSTLTREPNVYKQRKIIHSDSHTAFPPRAAVTIPTAPPRRKRMQYDIEVNQLCVMYPILHVHDVQFASPWNKKCLHGEKYTGPANTRRQHNAHKPPVYAVRRLPARQFEPTIGIQRVHRTVKPVVEPHEPHDGHRL